MKACVMLRSLAGLLAIAWMSLGPALAAEATAEAAKPRVVLPPPPEPYTGKVGRTLQDSVQMFQKPVTAPAGAPNIVLVLTDDVGFSAASTLGGDIETPTLDRLAAQGLLFNRFHTTAMCSSTRAALLTGRNHHAVATAAVTDMTSGYPGYSSILPKSAATLAEVLRQNGYNTAMFGKHHNIPAWEYSSAGPFDRWPTGLGFEYFYGFLGGDTHQWQPKLYRGISPILDPTRGTEERLLDRDMADEALNWIHNQKAAAPDKPFFVYYAPGTAHSPHHAPKDWIERYRGRFDAGWDKLREEVFARQKRMGVIPKDAALTPRPAAIPSWNSFTPEQQHHFARMMEVYAAMLAYQDAQIGRIVDELDRMGIRDNTLIMFIEGDNGASPEGRPEGSLNELGVMVNGVVQDWTWRQQMNDELGGPRNYQLLSAGWAWALDTPFQWTKTVASHLGGMRNGLIVSWPKRIKDVGTIRSQFTHVIDVYPTVLELTGIPAPDVVNGVEQQRVDGTSFAYALDAPQAAERHTTQYFELLGNRGIYHEGWLANTVPERLPWEHGKGRIPVDDYTWELYDLRKDYSQSVNLAKRYPDKLKELQALFLQEAERNHVLPLDDSQGLSRTLAATQFYKPKRNSYAYWSKDISVSQSAAPSFAARSFSLIADVVIPPGGGQGVIVATGSWFAGWSFYLDQGRPVAHEAFSQQPQDQFRVAASEALPAGPATIRYDFDRDPASALRGGTLTISVNGTQVAKGPIDRTFLITAGLGETFDTGRDTGVPVIDYRDQAPFTGEIRKIEVLLR
jgi:arylsulfatase